MANYTSHVIMSELLFNKLNDKHKLKVKIDKNNMKLFSFGQDLTALDKECFHNTHKVNSKAFFINTIKYINENNLQYDSDVMAYLYGHIAHYTLDVTIHRFVNNIVNDVDKKGFLTPHTILECNLDKYLINKFNDDSSYLSIKPLRNKEIKSIVNNTYQNVYGYYNAINTYYKSALFIGISNKVVNFLYQQPKLLNIFMKKEQYDANSYFYYCLNKESYINKKYDKLLNESINKAEKMIKHVNRYLYNKNSDLYLNLIFNDAPYNGKDPQSISSIFDKIPILNEIKIK